MRLEFLRAMYKMSYSKEVVSSLLNHLAKSSLNQYQSAWKRFQGWLPYSTEEITMPHVAEFLVHYHQKLESRTSLTIRTALALPLHEGFGIDFEHKYFRMLAMSGFRKRPQIAKVVSSWSLDDSLKALRLGRLSLLGTNFLDSARLCFC